MISTYSKCTHVLPIAKINSFFFFTIQDVVIFFALVHFFIVSASIVQPGATAPLLEFNDVFDPAKDSQAAFMNMVTNYPNFVAEEWPHVLTWDLFVGRYIWLDGLKRGGGLLRCTLILPSTSMEFLSLTAYFSLPFFFSGKVCSHHIRSFLPI